MLLHTIRDLPGYIIIQMEYLVSLPTNFNYIRRFQTFHHFFYGWSSICYWEQQKIF